MSLKVKVIPISGPLGVLYQTESLFTHSSSSPWESHQICSQTKLATSPFHWFLWFALRKYDAAFVVAFLFSVNTVQFRVWSRLWFRRTIGEIPSCRCFQNNCFVSVCGIFSKFSRVKVSTIVQISPSLFHFSIFSVSEDRLIWVYTVAVE